MHPRFFLPLIAYASFSSCAPEKPAKPEVEAKNPVAEDSNLVGRIASIPADKRFVLIQSYGVWKLESGAILTTRGPQGRTANLRTTGEKMGEFAAADLQSGMVEQGDAVYLQQIPKPIQTLTIPEASQDQKQPLPKNVQKNN